MVSQERFSRQIPLLGMDGQERLSKAKVAVVGCGALGNVVAPLLARAGVGFLRLIDGDVVEVSNLPRCLMFEGKDLGRSKAITLKAAIDRGGETDVDAHYTFLKEDKEELIMGFDLVMDCTDGMKTRFLINSLCFRNRIPWVYGAVEGNGGFSASFSGSPCFRCLYPKDPPIRAGIVPVMNYTPSFVGAWQAAEGIRILTEGKPNYGKLFNFDMEKGRITRSVIRADRKCSVCSK